MIFIFQSCVAVPYVTEEVINRKLMNLPLGESKEDVIREFGPAHFVATIPRGEDLIEIFGYQMGNYTYSESGLIIFRNGRVVAAPRDPYEMLKFLYLLRVIDRAHIWKSSEDLPSEAFPALSS